MGHVADHQPSKLSIRVRLPVDAPIRGVLADVVIAPV